MQSCQAVNVCNERIGATPGEKSFQMLGDGDLLFHFEAVVGDVVSEGRFVPVDRFFLFVRHRIARKPQCGVYRNGRRARRAKLLAIFVRPCEQNDVCAIFHAFVENALE